MVEATAGREVIVCSGGVASPQLLELSGIGQPELIKSFGIEARHELPGVGEHLRDHINARIQYHMARPELSYNKRMQGFGRVAQALRYAVTRLSLIHI